MHWKLALELAPIVILGQYISYRKQIALLSNWYRYVNFLRTLQTECKLWHTKLIVINAMRII